MLSWQKSRRCVEDVIVISLFRSFEKGTTRCKLHLQLPSKTVSQWTERMEAINSTKGCSETQLFCEVLGTSRLMSTILACSWYNKTCRFIDIHDTGTLEEGCRSLLSLLYLERTSPMDMRHRFECKVWENSKGLL